MSRVWTVEPQRESSIHTVAMVLEPGRFEEYDPFLMLAEDWFQQGTFDVHPHRGIETVTFVIDGILEHYDNNSGKDQLLPGDVQWMTAGRGVIHKEDPAEGETVHSLQLWINLPGDKKMTAPRYQNLRSKDMPMRREAGAVVRVFSGSSAEIVSSTLNHVPVTMVEMILEPGATVTQDLPGSYNGFLYVLEGSGTFGANAMEGKKNQVVWLGSADDAKESEVTIRANEKLRVLLYAGEPVKERVVQYGPFVMNTEEEIRQAIDDYRNGKFSS
ncbi:pirin family protein [Fodinisporobacter ferrooxydans]|uniref:Pirin family protein n=1 Tax=Fodinisporobacter ferrooxydans TaxID=2901836 RepID=A0ABY4CS26_9BACL|nr:pirin family protein [Alicyclobacillaceae bacterium MYW30-H2]